MKTSSIHEATPALEEIAEPRRTHSLHTAVLLVALGMLIVDLWIRPLWSSFWVDETGTWWLIKGGLGQTISRALQFDGHSPAYFVIVWTIRSLGGTSEVLLRLPSLTAVGLATYLMYRLGRRLVDRETGMLAAIAFASFQGVALAASDARPYALPLLCMVASTLALVRWLDGDGRRYAVAFVVLAALGFTFHFLLGVPIVAQAIYAIVRKRRGAPVSWGGLAGAALALGALMGPSVPQVLSLFSRRGALSSPVDTSFGAFFLVLAPPLVMAGLGIGAALARLDSVPLWRPRRVSPSTPWLVLAWILAPVLIFYAGSVLTSGAFFSLRYLVAGAPGIALGVAWVIRSISPPPARLIIAATVAVVSLFALGSPTHTPEDWRGAARRVNLLVTDPTTPVLLHAAFSQSAQIAWLSQPLNASWLDAPASYYPMRGRIVPMPFTLDQGGREYLEQLTTGVLLRTNKFLLVTRRTYVPFREWLEGRLWAEGFRDRVAGTFGQVVIVEFERPVGSSA